MKRFLLGVWLAALLLTIAGPTAAQSAGGTVAPQAQAGTSTQTATPTQTATQTPPRAQAPSDATPSLSDFAAFPAPDPRARTMFGYASAWTPMILGVLLVLMAALINKLNPKKKRRIRRVTIFLGIYVTTFAFAVLLHTVSAEGWSRRVWQLADLFEILIVIDLLAILLFDVLLLALKIEVANIVHELTLGVSYILAFIAMMHRSGVELSGIIATSAVVTAVLGLSLQATLANVLGGIALQLDDSIHVGDWIQLKDGKQGRVKAIRWRSTMLETRDWDTIILPNALLLAEQINVLGQREDAPRQHRVWIYFHVDYRYSPEEVIRVVDEALQAAPIANVALAPRPGALVLDFAREGAISIATYGVRYWQIDMGSNDSTQSDVRIRIFSALKRAQIPLALPAHAIFVSQDDQEHAERKQEREMARRVSALEAIEMLQGLSAGERVELARAMRFAPFARGEVITRQGAAAHWLYVLVRGEVEVKVKIESGAEKLVTRMAAPNVFGEMGVMTNEPRTASVIAATEVDCYRIDKDAFHQLVQKRSDLAEAISDVMAKRRVELQGVREHLDAEQRLRREQQEKNRILDNLQSFFGLSDDMD
ncbi:MAG: mechanosensitive ion channel family protein [Deltaproteobacteria bacterium]|nr:mechanosensitive ion channel family protein [Deltaproteobacteria bacterium]